MKPLPNPSLNPLLLFFLEKESVNVGLGYKTGIVSFLYFSLYFSKKKKYKFKIFQAKPHFEIKKKKKQKTFVGM